jgi:hypothetical protein
VIDETGEVCVVEAERRAELELGLGGTNGERCDGGRRVRPGR